MPYNYKTEVQRYKKYYQDLEPKLSKPSNKAYTTIVFSFLVVSLFGWYAIRPTIQTIIYLQREIKDKTELSKKMEDKISALIEAQAYFQEVEPLLPVIDQALPTKPDAIPLVIQLRNLASRSGTLLKTTQLPTVPLLGQKMKPTTKTTDSKAVTTAVKVPTYDFSIAVQGTYPNVRTFLEGLTQMRRIVTIESVSIVPNKLESESTSSAIPGGRLLQLALRLKTYYLIE